MSKRPTDVRNKKMGQIIGDGADVLLDMERAVLLDGMEVCLVNSISHVVDQTQRPSQESIRLAMRLDGRVNKSTDRASVLFILDEDGAAAIISELLALATRVGPEFAERLMARLETLKEEGHLSDQS
jgi:hypothetical protein